MVTRTMCIAAMVVSALPSIANAQVRFVNTGTWPTTGPVFPGGAMYGGYPGAGWPGTGGWPGWGAGYPGYGGYSGWSTYPGIASVSTAPPPRMRPTLEPAMLVSRDVMFPRTKAADTNSRSDTTSEMPSKSSQNGASPVRPVSLNPAEAPDTRAKIRVKVPAADAELWFEGTKVGQTGLEREFVTPPLQGSTKYSYDVRVRWTDSSGQTRNVTQTVSFRAGDRIPVEFSEAGEILPAPKPKD